MASRFKYRVHDSAGQHRASCDEPEAAACLMGLYGDGASIRMRGAFVWEQGEDGDATDSYDEVAERAQMVLRMMRNARARRRGVAP